MVTSTTLAEIARQIDDGECLAPNDVDTFTRMIDATGPLNQHLRLELEPGRYDRIDPIDINSKVYGDLVTILYEAHWPKLVLAEHADRDAMADFILDWTLLNCEVSAFENGRRLRYRVEHDDANGPRRCYHPNVPTPGLQWIRT